MYILSSGAKKIYFILTGGNLIKHFKEFKNMNAYSQ